MINKDRIVPITKIDLISMYGFALRLSDATLAKVSAGNVEGDFEITSATTSLIADEPVKTVDFASGVSEATLYFVPSLDYVGFTINGAEVSPTGEVEADGFTLYKAVLASNAIRISKVGF